jgi:hypothetical protein
MSNNINQTKNGRIFRCASCDKIHIEFNNINFNFNDKEYIHFANYFKGLDGEYWELVNTNANYRRKIIVPVGHNNMNFLLNQEELEELKELLADANINNTIRFVKNFKYAICNN